MLMGPSLGFRRDHPQLQHALGDADATRLTLLGQFYDPNSPAFLEAAGVEPGDRVVELGCGHGGVAERITARVGESGVVYMSEIGVPAERSSRTPNTSTRRA